MNNPRFNEIDSNDENFDIVEESSESNLSKKLERRRRIEELAEERRLRAELAEFDLF